MKTRKRTREKMLLKIRWVRSHAAAKGLQIKKALKHRYRGHGPHLTHISYYAVCNAGDTALSECVRRTFNRAFDSPISWRLEKVNRPVDVQLLQRINASQALIIGGGGLFLPDTNANTISGWQWACSKASLDEIKVPIVLYSVGYNYFRGQEPGKLFIDNLNAIVEKSVFVGLRNHGSIESVKALLQESLRDKIRYQPCTTTLIRRIMPELAPKQESGKIAFNFAFDRADKRYGERQEEILREVVKSMYLLRDRGYEIYIVAHCVNDLFILSRIEDRKGIHVINASAWDLDKLAGFYNDIDVVLGMRGHAQMIPFGVNCHIISLGSHEKMRWFLEDVNATDWYVELTGDIHTLSERIVDKFEEVHERNQQETTRRIVEAQDRLLQITLDNMRTIKALMMIGGGSLHNLILLVSPPDSAPLTPDAYSSERRNAHAA